MGLRSRRMLSDREYMRDGERPRWGSPVVVLLIVLTAIFLLECVLVVFQRWSLSTWFGLNLVSVGGFQYWRLLTYQFLHIAPWPLHLLMNGVALWFFGQSLLESVGTRRFWLIYLTSGLAGAMLELASQAWHPAYGPVNTVGASACVMGLIGAFCFLHPEREVVFFLYVIPVRLRAMTMFWITFGYSLFGTVFPHAGIAHAAHLGGVLAGVGFVRLFIHEEALTWLRRVLPSQRVAPPPVVATAVRMSGSSRAARGEVVAESEPESPEDFIRREVDPILDKISAHGMQSLTEKERRVLEKARNRIRTK